LGKKKLMFLRVRAFGVFFFFFTSFNAFSQTTKTATIEEFFTTFNEYATDMGGIMALTSGLGLSWSDAFIGPLIDQIPHWGGGVSLGFATVKMENLKKLNDFMQIIMEPVFSGKQVNPLWAGEFRIGGFRTAPFDLGVKFGMIPAMALFGESLYEMTLVGGDFRWRLNSGYGIAPKISLGFEVNMINGGYTSTPAADAVIASALSSSGRPSGSRITAGEDAILKYLWNATVISAKIEFSKSFPFYGFTFYGGARGGFAITKTDFILSGENVAWGSSGSGSNKIASYNAAKLLTSATAIENFLPFGVLTLTNDAITVTYNGNAIDLQANIGVAFDFGRNHISIAYMVAILQVESGISISYRYQQP
jgi:hypothetical protein